MRDEGYIKHGHELGFSKIRATMPENGRVDTSKMSKEEIKELKAEFDHFVEKTNRPFTTMHGENMSISDRLLAFDMIQSMINRRFHSCLKDASQDKKLRDEVMLLSDRELVSKVCRKERLTLYNFLKTHYADQFRDGGTQVLDAAADGEVFSSSLNEERIKDLIH